MAEAGWQIWVKDGERYRLFAVAEPDFAEAEKLAVAQVGGAERSYSYHALPGSVVTSFLGMKRGQFIEWVPIDHTSTIRPGGTTRGGKYDANRT